jgi:hypothetical protein
VSSLARLLLVSSYTFIYVAVTEKPISVGALLVQPHVPALLTYIEGAVKTMGSQLATKGGKEAASKEALLELKILARLVLTLICLFILWFRLWPFSGCIYRDIFLLLQL